MQATFKDKFIKARKDPIHFVQTKDGLNRDCFYFLLSSTTKLAAFKNSAEPSVDLNDYGIIIASGFGHVVPLEIKAMLKRKYDFNADSLN